jgi:membrane fusion protein (multidrug efflux system)
MSPTARKTLFVVLILVVVMAALYFFGAFDPSKRTDPPLSQTRSQPNAVEGIVLRSGKIDSKILSTGTLVANEEIEIRSEIAGRITAINFSEGTSVRRGALLIKINDADLRADLKKLQLQEDLVDREVKRSKQLFDGKLISQEEYDAVSNKLMTVRADIDRVNSDIAKTEIYAPFSGMIGLRSVSNGSYISSSTLIARLQQIDPIKIDFAVPEKFANSIAKGTLITFTITGSEEQHTATVYAKEPKIDMATRTLKVRALTSNIGGKLLPGAFAKVEITLKSINDALAIPTTSIVPQIDGQKVFVYRSGKAFAVPVETGIRSDSSVQIISGLFLGDTIITTGLMQIRDKASVSIKKVN